MKRMILIVLVLLTLLAMSVASVPALAGTARKITGSYQIAAFGRRIFMNINAHEVDPNTNLADGRCAWNIYDEEMGWRRLVARVKCVTFGEDVDGADPQTAVISGQITSKKGWGAGVPGEWFRFWVLDGGLSSDNLDQWGVQNYGPFPAEFWPEGENPGCGYFVPPEVEHSSGPFDAENGNLTLHH